MSSEQLIKNVAIYYTGLISFPEGILSMTCLERLDFIEKKPIPIPHDIKLFDNL